MNDAPPAEIVIWWIGAAAAEPALLTGVSRRVSAEYRVGVTLHDGPDRPEGSWDAKRRQHSSTRILEWLLLRRPARAHRIVGLTDADLFIPILTFVFGEAQLGGRAAVVSIARLSPPVASVPAQRLLGERLRKEALHELGHTYGLVHCGTPGCVMGRSPGVVEIDAKGDSFCPDCRLLYDERRRHER